MTRPSRLTHEQRRRMAQTAEAVREGWIKLVCAAGVPVVAAVALLTSPIHPVWRGLLAGILLASTCWSVVTALLMRTYAATVGEWGESFTRELLKRECPGWPVVPDVPMEHRNIDHVAVSPRAVLAIETKFIGSGQKWGSHPRRTLHVSDAQRSARSLRLLLRSKDFRLDLPVVPVLVLWGPGAPKAASCWSEADGTVIVPGGSAGDWAAQWCVGPISAEQGLDVKMKLEKYRDMRRRHDEGRGRA